jgi:hypothetical protein
MRFRDAAATVWSCIDQPPWQGHPNAPVDRIARLELETGP